MRQRYVRNLEEKKKEVADYYVEATWQESAPKDVSLSAPCDQQGRWREVLAIGDGNIPFYAELGCGKGRFLAGMARRHPDAQFLGIEGHAGVLLRAAQRLAAEEVRNARVLGAYVQDLRELFGTGELDGLYLNFSDPWPKARHEKRRLTHRRRLATYRQVIRPGGFLAFKTDNEGLFAFTLEEVHALGYDIQEMTHDLHRSALAADNVVTEYEEKFSARGAHIHYLRIGF